MRFVIFIVPNLQGSTGLMNYNCQTERYFLSNPNIILCADTNTDQDVGCLDRVYDAPNENLGLGYKISGRDLASQHHARKEPTDHNTPYSTSKIKRCPVQRFRESVSRVYYLKLILCHRLIHLTWE